MNPQQKDSNYLNLLAARIRKLRQERGLKQYDLGVDERTVRRIESAEDNFNPSFLTLIKISETLEISISELLDFSDEKKEAK
jgi:transcriptional regulator with XRE-family HTH domain